jgi:hydroxyacyl-ACP dehydratase HTD2-like protein with hotdog domain
MFAGKRTTFHTRLQIGDEVRRESTIQSVTPKQGRSGEMVFVTVKADICSPRGLAITEEQVMNDGCESELQMKNDEHEAVQQSVLHLFRIHRSAFRIGA